MKLPTCLIILACFLAAPVTQAGTKKTAQAASPTYETAAQIKAMPPCKATVERDDACYALFRTADGKKFGIGSPAAGREVIQFLSTLMVGQTYEFPRAFLVYQQKTQP